MNEQILHFIVARLPTFWVGNDHAFIKAIQHLENFYKNDTAESRKVAIS